MIDKILQYLVDPENGTSKNVLFFFVLAALSTALTYLCRRYVRIMDYASERSSHVGAIPRTGGIAIVLTFSFGILTYRMIHAEPFDLFHAFWGLLLSSLVIAVVSFYDDLTDRGLLFKVMSQLAGVAILFAFGIVIKEVTVPFWGSVALGLYAYPLTLLWVVGMTNAFNFMDGLNGLAGGIALIVSMAFMLFCLNHGSGFMFHVSYMIGAACLGFLFFNFPRGSIFMGDVGSTFLGFLFAAMAILAANYDSAHTPFMVMPLLFANVIMETLFTFVRRLFLRQPVHRAHRMHPYQLLGRMGMRAERVTMIYYVQSLILAALCGCYLWTAEQVSKMAILGAIVVSYSLYYIIVSAKAWRKGIGISS